MREKIEIIRNMGLHWTLYRAQYEVKKKLGLLQKQFPAFSYSDIQLDDCLIDKKSIRLLLNQVRNRYFFSEVPTDINIVNEFDLQQAVKEANQICSKDFKYFSYHSIEFDELDWKLNPKEQKSAPSDKHWSMISDLGGDFGDIKWVWELSRFTFVYPLVRAYAVTENDKYAEVFWAYFEDFIKNNPPELGPNYKCGQEMSFRIMAWTFGLFAFLDHPSTTEERLELWIKAIYYHADHIDKHFDFALKSVKNNHSISEAVGMYTVGILFPFLDKAEKWHKKGKKYIHSEAMWQIYADGSYIQHSMNYQRLAIQDLTWAIRLGQINNDSFDEKLLKRFEKAILFMYQNQNLESGRMPNYGMNDGSYIHPLTSCEYSDHRPPLQAAWYILKNEMLYSDSSINEIMFWISGAQSLRAHVSKVKQQSTAFPNGGYYTFRGNDSFGVVRCATYKHRPAQADMLHFDLWYKGKNILADAGTFSYNTDLDNMLYFNGTASHNTVLVNGQDQMKKASRFIWLNWTKSKLIDFVQGENHQIFVGEHYGYGDITHRRAILQIEKHWVIVDDIFGNVQFEKEVALQWLFGIHDVAQIQPFEWFVTISENEKLRLSIYSTKESKSQLYKGSLEPIKGWQSLYYGHKEPYPQIVTTCHSKLPLRFVTVIESCERQHEIDINKGKLVIEEFEFSINEIGNDMVFNLK